MLATWEAEIRRITVQGQPRKIVLVTPISKNNPTKRDWRCASNSRSMFASMKS
jgi:hypothetical protein